ncbi:ankyrin, partial [Choiromyces venosus 120613-1]
MGYDEIVRLLIKNRANMYPINHMGTSLMHTAASEGHEKTVVTLAERMSAGCINSRDHWGDTPMHVAASNGHVAVLKALFHLGANVNSIRKDGSSPLSLAVAIGSPATVSTLLDLGAQVRPLD